jgi:hypothetical protein
MSRCASRFISAAALFCALLVLCGCEISMDVRLRADGTGTAAMTCYLSRADQAMGLTAARMKRELLPEHAKELPNVKVEVTQGSNEDEEYVRATIPFGDVRELVWANPGDYQYEKQVNAGKCTFRILSFDLHNFAGPARLEVHMPGKILASNADFVQDNVARWSDTAIRQIAISNSSQGLYAQSEAVGKFPYLWVLLILASILFGGILLCLPRSRRLKSHARQIN